MYKNRTEAGQKLAILIQKKGLNNPFVFGLARGGVITASLVAEKLSAPFDVLVIRKLGAPGNPEFGFGAIATGETEIIEWQTAERLGLDPFRIAQIIAIEKRELLRRLRMYRGSIKYPSLAGKTAILVDDGIATGASIRAAIAFMEILRPKSIVIATPVCAADTATELKKEADVFICPLIDKNFMAVGQYYQDFPQVTDEEVIFHLKQFKK